MQYKGKLIMNVIAKGNPIVHHHNQRQDVPAGQPCAMEAGRPALHLLGGRYVSCRQRWRSFVKWATIRSAQIRATDTLSNLLKDLNGKVTFCNTSSVLRLLALFQWNSLYANALCNTSKVLSVSDFVAHLNEYLKEI